MAIIQKTQMLARMWNKRNHSLYTVSRNVIWHSHYGKKYVGSSKKLKIQLPYNPEISLLGIYPKKMQTLIQWDTCTPNVHNSIFTITNIQKQLKYPLIDEYDGHIYTHRVEYYSEKEQKSAICNNVDRQRILCLVK